MLGTWINKSAAQRILKGLATKIIKVWAMPNGAIAVSYTTSQGKGCTIISRKAFLNDAIAIRKNYNKHDYKVIAASYPECFEVKFESSPNWHHVMMRGRATNCHCNDAVEQINKGNGFSSTPFCKHINAVVASKGFKSFAEYCQAVKVTA